MSFKMWWSITLLSLLLDKYALAEWMEEESCNMSRTSSKGREFILAFVRGNSGSYDVKLFASSTHNVTINVESPYPRFNVISTVNLAGIHEITLNANIEQSGTNITNKGVLIRASSPIYLHGLRYPKGIASVEAFTALPTETLSKTYVISSYFPYTYSYVSIVGVYDGTTVSIKQNDSGSVSLQNNTYVIGKTMSINLNRLQTYLLERSSFDLSGAIVTSNKIITVLSGGISPQIPPGSSDGDPILSQLIPVEHWDKVYIVSPLYPRSESLIRIYAFYPNTSISIWNETYFVMKELSGGGFLEEIVRSGPVLVNSSKPISVVQYAYSQAYDSSSNGDSLMMVIPGIHQYSSDYMFPTKMGHFNGVRHYVSIIIKKNSLSGLRLDGYYQVDKIFPVRINGDEYVVAITELTDSFHNLTHVDNNVKFGALVYGFASMMGYGFPAGMEFSDIGSCTTTFSPSKETNLVCLSCAGMSHLKYCNLVDTCTDSLGCFVEQYQIGSHTFYDSGCITSFLESCDLNHNVLGRCSRCCNTSYCNSHGCGDDGYGSRNLRGPLCYDCQHLGNPSECIRIVQCAQGELCYIEEDTWGDSDKVYYLGCRPKYHCRLPNSVLNPDNTIFGRSVSTCSQCCEGDFCNTNCTLPPLTPIIGCKSTHSTGMWSTGRVYTLVEVHPSGGMHELGMCVRYTDRYNTTSSLRFGLCEGCHSPTVER